MNDRIDTSQWQRLGVLFEQAIGLDAAEQAELLRTTEREDTDLAKALASMLAADARHHARTAEHRHPVVRATLDAVDGADVVVGDRLGPYILREDLGRGGMGVVFRAERADGQVRQEVALKVIKLGMDTHEVIARFEAERQALAMMEHPHIARMLDVGATGSGRPYFVMELVKGEPISNYCARRDLPISQRLQLFAQVCAAVQHAHTKGIIHRDLKPSNVLVSTQDDHPVAKVIDFGIAKAISGRLTDKTLLTEQFLMIGTPLYMSPEQAEGSPDIDTRTDIYALGVILYELLTDTTPIDSNSLRSATQSEVQRIIREVDPPRPSTRLSKSINTKLDKTTSATVARRGPETRRLARMVRGDLDWIVMKAIDKDRARRYETANALALDLRRHLSGEAVLAAPPGAVYRMRKFARRNRAAVVAGCLIAVALLVGILAFAWQAHVAQQHASELAQVARFEADMLKQVDPTQAGKLLQDDMQGKLAAALVTAGVPESERSRQVAAFAGLLQHVNATDTARDLVDRTILKPAIAAIETQFRNQPVVAATLRQVLADRYIEMGLYDAAMPLQQSALATRRRVLGEAHPDTLQSISGMGELLQSQGRLVEAEPFLREALIRRRRVLGEEDPNTIRSIADMGEQLEQEDKLSEAEPYLREALEKSRRVNGEESKETLELLDDMGDLLLDQRKPSQAEPYLREALAKSRRALGEDNSQTLLIIGDLGWVLRVQGKLGEAEPYLREALEKSRLVLGEEHPHTLDEINIMGYFLDSQGKRSDAERYFREVLEKRRRVLGEENPFTLMAIENLGRILEEQGKPSKAEPYFREALEKRRRTLGDKSPDTLFAIATLGMILVEQEKLDEAEPYLREALQKSRRELGEKDPTTLYAIGAMGSLLQEQGKLSEAEPYFREVLDENRRAFGETGRNTQSAIIQMSGLLLAEGRYGDAETLLATIEVETRKADTRYSPYGNSVVRALVLMNLGKARTRLGKFAAAETNLLEAQPTLLKTNGPQDQDTRKCTQAVIDLYNAWNIAEPGNGHQARAVAWKRKLDELVAPASTAVGP